MKKKFTKILILSIFTILIVGGFAKSSFATVAPLSVTFSSSPLFSEANFAPGNEVIRDVGVSNNSGNSQNIIIEAVNAVDTGGLGDKLNLVIKEGDATRYTGTLGAFLRAGEISLSQLSNTSNTTYSFGVTFDSSANDNLQNKTLGFDLCVGFSGGDKHCGNTVIGGENGTDGGGTNNPQSGGNIPGSGGGGGGGNGGQIILVISNEQSNNTLNQNASTTTTITWDTNKLSTSQVVYGLVSGGPYNLIMTPPNFGYPLASIEDSTKVIHHSVLLTGLVTGETYVYRVVSHASPPTIGFEHQFTVPLLAFNNSNNLENTNGNGGNSTTGIGLSNTNGSSGISDFSTNSGLSDGSLQKDITAIPPNNTDSSNNLTATALLSGLGNLISNYALSFILLVLLILYLIWRFWLRRKNNRKITK